MFSVFIVLSINWEKKKKYKKLNWFQVKNTIDDDNNNSNNNNNNNNKF